MSTTTTDEMKTTETQTPPLTETAKLILCRLSNGQVQYTIAGTDPDLAGLLAFGSAVVHERMRSTVAAVGNQKPAIVKLPPEMEPKLQ